MERKALKRGLILFVVGFAIAAAFIGCPAKRATVDVKVCAVSGQVAGEYCPPDKVATLRFYKNPEPGEPVAPAIPCQVHQKPVVIPPPPKPTVRAWIGAYDFLVASGNWRAAIARARKEGVGLRFFASCNWNWTGTEEYLAAAYDEAAAERIRNKDPQDLKTVVNDGGIMVLVRESGARFPIRDYTKENPAYWNHLREVLAECAAQGVPVWISILDYSTLKTSGDDKYFSAWYCAIQRLSPGIYDGTWGAPMRPWIAGFIGHVIQEIKASGADYLIEDMNEGFAVNWPEAFVVDWFTWSHSVMVSAGADPARIVSTVSMAAIATLAALYSPHGIGTADKMESSVLGIPAPRLIWSSDGFYTGTGGADAKGRRGVGLDQAPAIRARILALHGYGGEILAREAYAKNNDRADLDAIVLTWAVVHAIAFAAGL